VKKLQHQKQLQGKLFFLWNKEEAEEEKEDKW